MRANPTMDNFLLSPKLGFFREEKLIYPNFNYIDQITLNFMLKFKIFLTNIFFNNVRELCRSLRSYTT